MTLVPLGDFVGLGSLVAGPLLLVGDAACRCRRGSARSAPLCLLAARCIAASLCAGFVGRDGLGDAFFLPRRGTCVAMVL